MKKKYMSPALITVCSLPFQNLMDLHSYRWGDSREMRDRRFNDYENYEEDPNDFDSETFWEK